MKKFRKNNWEEEEEVSQKRKPKNKKFQRALKTRDINYLLDHCDDDEDY
jgi:hypothetical protein